ncbi:uncharacterized protein CIMG_12715 [Coccidioides immitis RS]|uniref:Uncharacterized protein n=1 Tax=Coccidioides immitis (strain RS) TaxID=246410 RepID=J3KKQ6_COCIM|nr:uncharacterized protein CIMG_12715 [Coccidioides immitis RS]EAS36775.3 hypothetical protein CIMG_12715 [Coccidioides immitis RS]
MIKDQEIKKSESEPAIAEDTTESYAIMLQSENKKMFLQKLPKKLQNKIIDKAKLNFLDNILPTDFRKVIQMTINLINQYKENKKIFKQDEIKQKEIKKLVKALKKTASSTKTKESELKSKAKSSEDTNIEAVIEKMFNKFTNLALIMRVQSNKVQENPHQYYILQRKEPSKPILNYPTNVTTNFAMVQENT